MKKYLLLTSFLCIEPLSLQGVQYGVYYNEPVYESVGNQTIATMFYSAATVYSKPNGVSGALTPEQIIDVEQGGSFEYHSARPENWLSFVGRLLFNMPELMILSCSEAPWMESLAQNYSGFLSGYTTEKKKK